MRRGSWLGRALSAAGLCLIAPGAAFADGAETKVRAADDTLVASFYGETFDPRSNDSDPAGGPLVILDATPGRYGLVSVNGGSSITYWKLPQAKGEDRLTYRVRNAAGIVSTAAVHVVLPDQGRTQVSVMRPEKQHVRPRVAGGLFEVDPKAGWGVNLFIDQLIASGKRYWEVRLLCGPLAPGVTNDVLSPKSYGGYDEVNAGFYTWTAVPWPKAAVVSGSGSRQQAPSGTVFGFALDADARTLQVLQDNVPLVTLRLGMRGPYYPHSGTQPLTVGPGDSKQWDLKGQPCSVGPSRGEFLFGKGRTKYTPPPGFEHLSN